MYLLDQWQYDSNNNINLYMDSQLIYEVNYATSTST